MDSRLSFAKILELDHRILSKYLSHIISSDEYDHNYLNNAENIEEMQAILFSFVDSHLYFDEIYEISSYLSESYELIHLLLESNNYQFTITLFDQLEGLQNKQFPIVPLLLTDNRVIVPVMLTYIGDVLILFDDHSSSQTSLANQAYLSCDRFKGHRIISNGLRFGYHELTITSTNPSTQTPMITKSILFTSSPLYTYCIALDSCLDQLTWGWTGNWTSELEASIFELLISVNDDLVGVILNMRSMFSGLFSSGVDDLEEMLKLIQEDLRLVLTTRSNYSLGRLHQTFFQFLEMNNGITGSFMKIPPQFIQAIEVFYQAKVMASPSHTLFEEIRKLYNATLPYLASFTKYPQGAVSNEGAKLTQFLHLFYSRIQNKTESQESLAGTGAGAGVSLTDPCFERYVSTCKKSTELLWPHQESRHSSSSSSSSSDSNQLDPPLTFNEISSILHLKPSEMSMMSPSSVSSLSSSLAPWEDMSFQNKESLSRSLTYHPVLPLEALMDSSTLQRYISFYSESLLMDCLFIQSVFGYSIKESENSVELTCRVLQQILDNGLTYVISQPSAKLMILFPLQRSMIFLQKREKICQFDQQNNGTSDTTSPADNGEPTSPSPTNITHDLNYHTFHQTNQPSIPHSLQKRIKDFSRIFRNKIQKKLSFCINSNFEYSLQCLREHHGDDCWINTDLERVWLNLLSKNQFFIFELWYDENILLAADFCHLSCQNKGIYVATRYHNSNFEFKSFQSGYLLSVLSCCYLQKRGYVVWDLGGVDLCPLMRYKYDVCGEAYYRAESRYLLKKIQEYSGGEGEGIESGVIIPEVTVDDVLWKET